MRASTAACIALVWNGCALADYVPRSEVDAAVRIAAVEAKSAPDQIALAARLDQARLAVIGDPLNGEAALQQTLLQLRESVVPQPSTRAQVETLIHYAPLTYTDPVDPEPARGALTVPAFAIAATARGTLRRWDRTAAIAALERALRDQDLDALRAIDDRSAWLALIAQAHPAQLPLLRDAAPDDADVRSALAVRMMDPALARDILSAPASTAGLALIAALPGHFPPPAAFALLHDARLDPGYISASRLAMAHLPWDATIQSALLQSLGDANGASSAQALAADPLNLPALRALLDRQADDAPQRRALLALRWMDTPEAEATLAAFSRDLHQPASLREEVRQWLR